MTTRAGGGRAAAARAGRDTPAASRPGRDTPAAPRAGRANGPDAAATDRHPPRRAVLVLNGPIGVGRTSLGRALAARLGGGFLDGDDLRDPAKRWFEEVLSGARALVRDGLAMLSRVPLLVVAKPLRARDWAWLRARFRAAGVAAFCVTLTASRDAILAAHRGRAFDAGERDRIAVMIAQGYGARPFSDLVVATDAAGFAETLDALAAGCRALLARPGPASP